MKTSYLIDFFVYFASNLTKLVSLVYPINWYWLFVIKKKKKIHDKETQFGPIFNNFSICFDIAKIITLRSINVLALLKKKKQRK